MRGATAGTSVQHLCELISTHAPRAGSDASAGALWTNHPDFNPRSPCGERRSKKHGEDVENDFNPRSPCGERRMARLASFTACLFQPTLPVRGATVWSGRGATSRADFNPRSPCGERRVRRKRCLPAREFQPTLPVRGATAVPLNTVWSSIFQPTLPVRGATHHLFHVVCPVVISTHAPRAGSDSEGENTLKVTVEFQPTLPVRGATPQHLAHRAAPARFQPTLPVRGATCRGNS